MGLNCLIKHKKQLGLVIFLLLLASACNNGDFNPVGTFYPSEVEVEAALLGLVNEERRKQDLPEVIMDVNVAAVARAHSADMRDRNYFSHTNPDGKSFDDRLRSAGISFRLSGENIGRTENISNPATFTNTGFLSDATHRNVLLNKQFTRVGIGVARSGNNYWITQDFIKP